MRAQARISVAFAAVMATLFASQTASAVEPWSDADPDGPPQRLQLGAQAGFRGGLEYRANGVLVRPLDLNGTRDRNYHVLEHRLRLDAGLDWEDKVRLVTSVDVMDGVMWGDNGTLGKAPEPTSGANVSSTNPNAATSCLQLRAGDPPGEARSYHFANCPADPVFVRRLYGDVITPVGLFRIGRQAFTEGASLAVNDGDGRRNRFGFARRGNSADRILFATKPLEGFKPKEERNKSETEGTFFILAYDRLVTDDPSRVRDDLHGFITAIRTLAPDHPLGHDGELRLYYAHRWDHQNDTGISAFGGRAMTKSGDFQFGAEAVGVAGSTFEIANAFRVITNDPSVKQDILQFGARAVARYDQPAYTFYFEADYASGDSDPTVRTPLTQFRFSEDTNVGLLMFEHVFAYQTARAAAAGVNLLQNLNAPSYPLDAVSTRGSFTNAFAIFPQADLRPIDNLLLRGGVLMAWAPSKVVDPFASLQRRDGLRIEDDLVNFAGGSANKYYGTEVDGRVSYRFMDHFVADLEGAVLFPGSALEDANGDAANSYLVQARGTFFF